MPSAIDRIQARAIAEAADAIHAGRDVLLKAPTGAGKTKMTNTLAGVLDGLLEGGRRPKILHLSNRQRLTTQGGSELDAWTPGIAHTVGMHGDLDQSGDRVYSTVQTAAARSDELVPYDLAIIDEAHHAAAHVGTRIGDYGLVMARLEQLNPAILFIATTATTDRADHRDLHPRVAAATRVTIGYKELERAEQIVLPQTIELSIMDAKHRDLRCVARSLYDPARTDEHDGVRKALRAARSDDHHHQVANAWERHADGLPTLAYEARIDDARAFAEMLNGRGIPAAVLDSKQSARANAAALSNYETGLVRLLVSVGMIEEGLNVPATRCALILKETTSSTQYEQIVGRTVRAKAGAMTGIRPKILDAGASTLIHGAIENRAVIADYIGRLERRELAAERTQSGGYMPHRHAAGGYSPWKVVSKTPPVVAMTDGEGTIFARIARSPTGELRFAVAETHRTAERHAISMLRDADGRIIRYVNAAGLEAHEAVRVIQSRQHLMRLAVTASPTDIGSLADDRIRRDGVTHLPSFVAMTDALKQASRVAPRSATR